MKSNFRSSLVLFLLAIAAIGLGHLAFLPPWEGFDEPAHYSYTQQLAETGHRPHYGVDKLSRIVESYGNNAPNAYGNRPPFEKTGNLTYREFRDAPKSAKSELHRQPKKPRTFKQGRTLNWQSQHPPLYYLSQAPIYLLTKHLSWVDHILALRVVSFAFAFIGFACGIWATWHFWPAIEQKLAASHPATSAVPVVMATWPLFAAMFFPEMARMGNDSLCLLLMGPLWALALKICFAESGFWDYAGVGILLGLGGLTKALFLPIGFGFFLFLTARVLLPPQAGAGHADRRRILMNLAMAGLIAVSICGWWYFTKLFTQGSFVGSDEFIRLSHQGGLIEGLREHFSLLALARGMASMVASIFWPGTWSLARLPEGMLAGPVALFLILMGAYFWGQRRTPIGSVTWLPVYLVAPTVLGLMYHILVRLAFDGRGIGTPGWYLHILSVPLAFAAALGLAVIWRSKLLRWLVSGLAAYSLGYALLSFWFQLLLFSGCAFKAGTNKTYQLPHDHSCLWDWSGLTEQLGYLGYPNVGFATLLLGWALAAVGGMVALRRARSARSTL
ncbi:MAG: hypothetical protein AAF530_12235 [Pseudomonadota bacterium]